MANKKINITDFDDITKQYMKEIGNTKPLSVKEEQILWNKYKNEGDEEARNKLITSNLKFVAKIANNYRGRGLSYSDLIAEGNLGLIKSFNYFDINRGNRILSYSVWWIKQSIIEALEKRNSYVGDLLPEELEFKGNDLKGINFILDDFINGNVQENKNNDEKRYFLKKAMKILSKREKDILSMYFGIDTGTPCTLEEVGKEYGLTKERVRQINEKSLKKLRSYIVEKKLY